VISPPLLAEPPGDLAGLVRAEELVDPAWAQAGRGRDLADGQPRLMGFDDGPDPLPLSPFQAFRGQAESGGKPLLASDPLFQLVVGFPPSRPSIGPVAVQRTGRLRTGFIGAGPFFGARGEHVERNVSLATSAAARLRRPVGLTAVRRTDVFAFEPGPASWKHAPTPERRPRQEPLGRNRPTTFTLCYKVSGPSAIPPRFEPVDPRERD
jgi:hypothetical protein